MSNDTSSNSSGGVSFLGLLTVLFIGLKLTGYIAWPWLWVLAPLWLPMGLVLLIIAAALLAVGVVKLILLIAHR